jgi:hypothetical protein
MINLNALSDQIKIIIMEHKDCGGHCHSYGHPNTNTSWDQENEHLSLVITYFVWGVINNGISRND